MTNLKQIQETLEILDKINVGETAIVRTVKKQNSLGAPDVRQTEISWYTTLENTTTRKHTTPISFVRECQLRGDCTLLKEGKILTLSELVESGALDGLRIPRGGVIEMRWSDKK